MRRSRLSLIRGKRVPVRGRERWSRATTHSAATGGISSGESFGRQPDRGDRDDGDEPRQWPNSWNDWPDNRSRMPGPVGRAHKAPGIVKTGAGPGVRTLLVVPEGTRIGAGPEVSLGTETMVLFTLGQFTSRTARGCEDAFSIGLWLGFSLGR